MAHDDWTGWLTSPAALTVANLFLQSAIVIALGLLAGRFARRAGAGVQSAILRTTLVAIVACPLAAWMLAAAGAPALRLQLADAAAVATGSPEISPMLLNARVKPAEAIATSPHDGDTALPGDAAPNVAAQPKSMVAASRGPSPESTQGLSIGTLLAILSGFVALALLARIAVALLLLRKIRRAGQPAAEATKQACARLARQMHVTPPPVLISDRVDGPCLMGVRRPAILLPFDDAPVDDEVLVHELAHVARGDCGWQLAARVVSSLLWFQPLAWLLTRQLERIAEDACDDAVIAHAGDAERATYAAQLLALAERHQWHWPTRDAAVGVVGLRSSVARRVVRILDSTRAASAPVGRQALAGIVTLGIGGTLLAAMLGLAPAAATQPSTTMNTTEPADLMRVRGKVLDADGKPAAGASVTVPGPRHWDRPLEMPIIARATADADGRYDVSFRKSDLAPFSLGGGQPGADQWRHAQVIASARAGIGIAMWDDVDAAGEVELKLARDDAPIRGRIVGPDGKPIAGVQVAVDMLAMADEETLGVLYSSDRRSGERMMTSLPLRSIGRPNAIVTDADGRFRIDGLGRDRRAFLRLFGPNVGYARFEVETREMERKVRRTPQPVGYDTEMIIYGATFEHRAERGRSVEGTITDAATGKPMPGIAVQSLRFADRSFSIDPQRLIATVTDANGHYRLDGFPPGDGRPGEENSLIVVPNDEQPYFMREATIPDQEERVPRLDLELHRGVWITGKVTDRATGQPLPARMLYTTYGDNEHVQQLPEFRRERGANFLDGYQSRYETRPDGTYRLVAAPGKAIVAVWCMLEGYRNGVGFEQIPVFQEKGYTFKLFQNAPHPRINNVVREVDVPFGAEQVTCDLQVDPGGRTRVAVTDADGKPAARRLMVRGQDAETYGGPYFRPLEGPAFDAAGFSPDEERTMFVLDDERKVGRAVPVKADAQGQAPPIEVQLQPYAQVTGRLLTKAGEPLPATQLDLRDSRRDGRTARFVTTDADGKFTIAAPAGVSYHLSVWSGRYVGTSVAKEVKVEPGAIVDLGELRIAPYINDADAN